MHHVADASMGGVQSTKMTGHYMLTAVHKKKEANHAPVLAAWRDLVC
jgi:hypothetical protein